MLEPSRAACRRTGRRNVAPSGRAARAWACAAALGLVLLGVGAPGSEAGSEAWASSLPPGWEDIYPVGPSYGDADASDAEGAAASPDGGAVGAAVDEQVPALAVGAAGDDIVPGTGSQVDAAADESGASASSAQPASAPAASASPDGAQGQIGPWYAYFDADAVASAQRVVASQEPESPSPGTADVQALTGDAVGSSLLSLGCAVAAALCAGVAVGLFMRARALQADAAARSGLRRPVASKPYNSHGGA